MPKQPEVLPTHCTNCNTYLQTGARYCARCGQKTRSAKVGFWELVKDALDNVFNLDSRFFHTLAALLRPGQYTLDFFSGKQARHVNTFRAFLISSILLLAAGNMFIPSDEEDALSSFNKLNAKHATEQTKRERLFQHYIDSISHLPGGKIKGQELQALKIRILGKDTSKTVVFENKGIIQFNNDGGPDTSRSRDGFTIRDSIDLLTGFSNGQLTATPVSSFDYGHLSTQALLDKYQIKGTMNRMIATQMLKVAGSGKSVLYYMLDKSIYGLLFMIPVFALFYQILYIRQKRYYVEHLVFNFHVHTALFFFLSVFLLTMRITGTLENENLWVPFLFMAFLYILVATKRYYQQGWIKTFFKVSVLSILYTFVFTFALAALALIGFLLF